MIGLVTGPGAAAVQKKAKMKSGVKKTAVKKKSLPFSPINTQFSA